MAEEHPWIKSYPPGVRWDAQIRLMPVHEILDETAAKWPNNPAMDFMGKKLTYREFQDLANRIAKGFQEIGVKPGVHVGLYLPNTPHYAIAFFGVLKAGGTVVNYSPLDAEKVLEHKIEDSETDIIVTLDMKMFYPRMAGLLGKTRLKKLVIGNVPEMTPHPDAIRAHLAKAGELVDIPTDDRRVPFAKLIDNDGRYQRHPIADPKEIVAVLQYTGGTTGLPKGAMLTHANLSAATHQFMETTRGHPPTMVEGQERILVVLPLFHIYALTICLIMGVRLAAELVMHTRFEVEPVIKDIETKKITSFPGVPTMYFAILSYPGIEKRDLSSLKWCNSGGAPLPVEVQRQFQGLTGTRLAEGWGMTETSPAGTFTPIPGKEKSGSCGVPVPGVDIKFLDVSDPTKYVPRGERGEMCIRGPNVMKGYWKKPQATAEIMTPDGYMRTGDVGYMDEDGYIFIVDRTKDMILCGGYNVYPRNIEEAIYQHPSVEEVIVIGIPDEYRGQAPKAFVKLKSGAPEISLEEMKVFLKDKLGKHEMISAMEIRESLPKTAVGKLSKKELYEEEERKRAAAAA